MTFLAPGTIFAGEYRIERTLAQGGMGVVYCAEQITTGQRRALKVMQPQLAPDERSRQRFLEEARIGSRIQSEHVVQVVAAGVDASGVPWLAMELLDGVDLERYVSERGPLPWQEVLELLQQITHALGDAHTRGIIHRDLKPENLFVARSRRSGGHHTAKILDFGIATLAERAATVTSAIGSPLWMAPEQAQTGATLRPSTDVWALGLIVFFILTGRRYWVAANQRELSLSALLVEVMTHPIELATQRCAAMGVDPRHLPPGFDAWFARCLNRNVDQRFPDAAAAMHTLTPLLGGTPALIATRPHNPIIRAAAPAPKSNALLYVLAAGVLVIMALIGGSAGAVIYVLRQRPEPSPRPVPRIDPPVVALAIDAGPALIPEEPLPAGGPAGTLDTTFGAGGVSQFGIEGGENRLQHAVLTTGGALLGVAHLPTPAGIRLSVVKITPQGRLDPSFASQGVATIGNLEAFAEDITVASDGAALVVGHSYQAGVIVGRVLPDGRLDETFGHEGVSNPVDATYDPSVILSTDVDHTVIVGAHRRSPYDILPGSRDDNETFVMHLDRYGRLDPTYGTGGVSFIDATPDREFVTGAAFRADGTLVATGYAPLSDSLFACAVLPNGRPSAAFGTAGATRITSPAFFTAWAMALDAQGRAYIGGQNAESHAVILRLTPEGFLDASWGQGGISVGALDGEDQLYSLILQPDGRVVGVGFRGIAEEADFFLVRMTTEGRLDPSFGGGTGYQIIDRPGQGEFGLGAVLSPDRRSVLVSGDSTRSMLVARFWL